ncbi:MULTISPECIES: DegT/DnrJ/EryC1/StrS family aminotransferase [Mesonia]|uniref:Pyridoxal phosphate-dependent aminotransferase EpsN n=1 Tax=Mesonia oceanica TaxID=2687242 RepID=A0AC61YAX2_9FLAO|nr:MULTISPECIES: aminotransferase class I/II-fold pyridoxal phosphate-dependent enzyme [Mesonia]MAN27495.1 pyridoxal phosphate-dependent aminotransferase [Mesonia sp.]MAQ42496.1 pyridoxal phosphate-dependent aminotransferase [Mesonia sp.]MBJ96859.1 pyridoxal phosphate-dependent aminotransferase [Flavobacteriaceae bacterium]VVV01470.1 Putative pyridoxal phosphate-dependent aminotransferase EpsN [Mesonia oceanica]|tara:strand:- start:15401 stop:16543 length:1143 start_codon:yes stop_codon:yes gene_type:complete
MQKSKIWLSSPHMGGDEINYINSAFKENWIAPLGPNVIGFEKDLQTYLDENKKIAVLSSGTAAIHLSLIMLGVKRNDYVICQSMTFSASANPIKYMDAKAIFIDSEPDTWNMCPKALRKAIEYGIRENKKPKAVICVHLYGMPAQLDKIKSICDEYDIALIEDAAEALGSTFENQKCGTFGDYGILSFNGNKIITTSGGGALVCNSQENQKKAVFYATQARDDAPHYQHSEIGYNYRLSNISAGIGRGQMQVLDKHIALRRKMNQFYQELFKDTEGITVFKEPNSDYFSNHWLSAILVDSKKTKNNLTREDIRLAFEEENIESRPLWKPMHLQPVFKDELYFGGTVAEDLFRDGLCLPSGSNLTDEDRDRITSVIGELFK